MGAVLGLDAAWTPHGTWAYAALREHAGAWELIEVGSGLPTTGGGRSLQSGFGGGTVTALANRFPDVRVLTADIPLSRGPIQGRRLADQEVSRAYGARKAAAHSPTAERPGPIAAAVRDAARASGLELATLGVDPPFPCVIETYPHPAIIELMRLTERLPYKVDKRSEYWPDLPADQRLVAVAQELDRLAGALATQVSGLNRAFPSAQRALGGSPRTPAAALKRIEDQLDAVVCAWVATRFLLGECRGFGDAQATLWVPGPSG